MKRIIHSPEWENGVRKTADYYENLFANAQTPLPQEDIFAAPPIFPPAVDSRGRDNNHYPLHPHYLEVGLIGIAEEAEQSAQGKEGEAALLLTSVARVYRAAAGYMEKFADAAERACEETRADGERERLGKVAKICRALSTRAPQTFAEACELFLFCWRIRSHTGMATIGRLDQYLISFYRNDVAAGTLTSEGALELLVALWKRINTYGSGDTLTNVMLGGVDEEGNDATNELSCLMLKASLITRSTEPQINCRIHKNTPVEFFDLMAEVQLLGHGQASVYNDEVIIPELVRFGYPLVAARNYSNDGCNEIIIDAASNIDFFQMEAMKTMELTIFEGQENPQETVPTGYYWTRHFEARPLYTQMLLGYASKKMEDVCNYEEFYQAYLDQYRFQLKNMLKAHIERVEYENRTLVPSLFLLGSFPCFLKSGEDIYVAEEIYPIRDVFFGSVPTVADCLAAVKKVVFEDGACTLCELREALKADYVGHEDLRARLLAAPKVGNDCDEVDLILARLSEDLIQILAECNAEDDVKYLPCLYNYLFNDYAKIVGATPDGRRRGDPVSEHFSPTPGRAQKGPTAILRSLCKTDIGRGAGGSSVYLSLSRDVLVGEDGGKAIVTSLVRAAIELKVQQMNLAVYDAKTLRAAQKDPTGYEDIIVRVWGYSARFVDLAPDMQEHVIARIVNN